MTAKDPAAALPGREHPGKLSGQPPEVTEHPFFREGYRHGYNQGYQDRGDAERHAELVEASARRGKKEEPPPAPVHRFDAAVSIGMLSPGVVVERELSARTGDTFTSLVPCCGRALTVRLEDRRGEVHAACCRCGVLYRAGMRDEDDGVDERWDEPFYLVVFEVIALGLAPPGPAGASTRKPAALRAPGGLR